MNRFEILEEAKKIVCNGRNLEYGEPEDSFSIIAIFWGIYISRKCCTKGADVCILPEDVAAMMALLKISRIASGNNKSDNWIDIAGYAACGGASVNPPLDQIERLEEME